jgi:uncharacterized protein
MGGTEALGWGVLVGSGWLTGFCSGLLGIGGGLVIVPALIFGLPLVGVSSSELAKVAIATSLALIIPTSLASSQAHAARGNIDWVLWAAMAPSIVGGGLLASMAVQHISASLLILLFAGFALISAWRLLIGAGASAGPLTAVTPPSFVAMSVKGALGGALSTALGTGVAYFAVPMLARFTPLARAIGTASALALPMAVAGAAGYLLAPQPPGCAACTGYVHLPAVAAVGVATVLAAPVGAQLTAILPARRLRQLFALLLIAGTVGLLQKKLPELSAEAKASLVFPRIAWAEQSTPATAPAWLGREQPPSSVRPAAGLGPGRSLMLLTRRLSTPFAASAMARLAAAGQGSDGAESSSMPLPPPAPKRSLPRRRAGQRTATPTKCIPSAAATRDIRVGCSALEVPRQEGVRLPAGTSNDLLQTLFGGR